MVKYVYDAWGNHTVTDNNGTVISSSTHIGNFSLGVSITPWVDFKLSIGLDGVTLGIGINIGDTTHEFSVGIGLAPIAIIASIVFAYCHYGSSCASCSWFS